MDLSHNFKVCVVRHSIKNVSVNGCTDEFIVGSRTIDLSNFEIAIVACLMSSKCALTKNDLMAATGIPTASLFEQVFSNLLDELASIDIANYGGNGSCYEDTIYADELICEKDGLVSFNRNLAKIIGRKPFLSDAQLSSIQYQSKHYQPMACCV